MKVTLSDAEVKLLTNHRAANRIEKRTQALVLLPLDTGIRIEEALTLNIESVNFGSLILKVKGKGGKERLIPFSAAVRKVLWRLKVGKGLPRAGSFAASDLLRQVRVTGYWGMAERGFEQLGRLLSLGPPSIGPPPLLDELRPVASARGRPDEFYAQIAREFVDLLNANSRHPVEELSRLRSIPKSKVRDMIR